VINLANYRRLFSEAERAATPEFAVDYECQHRRGGGAGAHRRWLVVRGRVAVRRLIEGLLVLPWALPGTVFAVALATAFSTRAPLRFVLVGTAVILPLAYLVRGLPLPAAACSRRIAS
jgi:iron(III) transport system permease protein